MHSLWNHEADALQQQKSTLGGIQCELGKDTGAAICKGWQKEAREEEENALTTWQHWSIEASHWLWCNVILDCSEGLVHTHSSIKYVLLNKSFKILITCANC